MSGNFACNLFHIFHVSRAISSPGGSYCYEYYERRFNSLPYLSRKFESALFNVSLNNLVESRLIKRDNPFFQRVYLFSSLSTHVTDRPNSAKQAPVTSTTYPVPIIPICILLPSRYVLESID